MYKTKLESLLRKAEEILRAARILPNYYGHLTSPGKGKDCDVPLVQRTVKSFTVLEIIVCLSLLASLLSVVAVLGMRVMTGYKEEEELNGLKNRIKMIRLLSPVLYSPGELCLTSSEKGLETVVTFRFAPNAPIVKKELYPHLSIKDEELLLPFSIEGFAKDTSLIVRGSKEHVISL